MSLRTIFYMTFLLIIFCLLQFLVGGGGAFVIFSGLLLTQAVAFSINPTFHAKYQAFINPKMYELLMSKDEGFILRRRKSDTFSLYFVSIILLFGGVIQLLGQNDNLLPFSDINGIIAYGLIVLIPLIIISLLSYVILKKSVSQEYALNMLLGSVYLVVVFAGSIYYFAILT